MSSDDGIDYYKSFKLHHSLRHQKTPTHQPSTSTPTPSPATSTTTKTTTTTASQQKPHSHKHKNQHSQTGQYQSMSSISSSSSAAVPGTQSQCSTIQRRKLSVNYQHQLQITGECTLNDCPMVNGVANSPNRFSLSLQPHYDDQMMCCLPPPSPAPASDRYVMGIPCPSAIPPPQIPQTVTGSGAVISTSSSTISSSNSSYKFGSNSSSSLSSMNSSSLHRTMSPNSRLRMSDRFRSDAGTPSYNSNYINSTVHTPIKRYVPTPPPPNEMYPIEQTAAIPANHNSSASSASSTSGYQTGGSSVNPHVNTLPYRLRMKCCINEQTMNANVGTVTDHYATPPRMRPMNKCQAQQVKNPKETRTPSMENIVADNYSSSATACLHCNTMRRTTGVHQTTQTTGPISPVPQNVTAPSSIPNEVLTTPSTSNSHISPMSPQINLQQQQQNEIIQQQMIQQREQQQRQQAFQQQVAAANRHHQHQLNLMNQQNAAVVAATNYNTVHTTNQIQISAPAVTPQRSNAARQAGAAAPTNAVQAQRFTPTVSRKQKVKEYIRREIAKFFGVDAQTETEERYKWSERQKRFAIRRFGPLKNDMDNPSDQNEPTDHPTDRPDILPIADHLGNGTSELIIDSDAYIRLPIEKKASVPTMFISGITYIINTLNKTNNAHHAVGARASHAYKQQWSRSFAPAHVTTYNSGDGDNPGDIYEGLTMLQEEEVFFDYSVNDNGSTTQHPTRQVTRQMYMSGERVHGWRTSAIIDQQNMQQHQPNAQQHHQSAGSGMGLQRNASSSSAGTSATYRGTRISSQLLDGVLENSRRPTPNKIKLFHIHELDDRQDHRPFFTYWINTVQIIVLLLSLISYGIGPIGLGVQQKNGQVLVTSLSLQTVEHKEPRNLWVGPRSNDLVHLGAKFAACMRRDIKIMDVISKTKRQERETACCIRNDDSGCVQSSQADCSVRGLWPTVSFLFFF